MSTLVERLKNIKSWRGVFAASGVPALKGYRVDQIGPSSAQLFRISNGSETCMVKAYDFLTQQQQEKFNKDMEILANPDFINKVEGTISLNALGTFRTLVISPYLPEGNLLDYAKKLNQSDREILAEKVYPFLLNQSLYLEGKKAANTDLKTSNLLIQGERYVVSDQKGLITFENTAPETVPKKSLALSDAYLAVKDRTSDTINIKALTPQLIGCLLYEIVHPTAFNSKNPYKENVLAVHLSSIKNLALRDKIGRLTDPDEKNRMEYFRKSPLIQDKINLIQQYQQKLLNTKKLPTPKQVEVALTNITDTKVKEKLELTAGLIKNLSGSGNYDTKMDIMKRIIHYRGDLLKQHRSSALTLLIKELARDTIGKVLEHVTPRDRFSHFKQKISAKTKGEQLIDALEEPSSAPMTPL